MVLSIALFAKPLQGLSKLTISATSITNIRVMVDGNKIRANNNTVLLDNLKEGYHTVKVYRLRNNNRIDPNGNYQLVYSGNIYLKPRYHVDVTINRFGKAFIDEQHISADYYNEDDNDDWGSNDHYNDQQNQGGWNNNEVNRPMNTTTFTQFKQALRNESFDDTKLAMAKQVIAQNYLTSAQVKEIAGLFTFEDNKLDIAKYAYQYTVDKGSYFIVNEVFVFSSSKDALLKYIQTNG